MHFDENEINRLSVIDMANGKLWSIALRDSVILTLSWNDE